MNLEVRESRRLWAPPAEVWAVVRELDALDSWLPWVASCRLEGDLRSTVPADPDLPVIVERIVDFDEERHAYSYEYLEGPLRFSSYLARVQVLPFGGTQCEVTWVGSFSAPDGVDPDRLKLAVRKAYRSTLKALRAHCVREPDGTLSLPPTPA